jgi:hypothetical protein
MRRLLIALFATAALGCGVSDDIELPTLPPTSANVEGDYTMRSANGSAPPFVAFTTSSGETWELASDKIFVKPDGTWSEVTLYVVHKLADGTQTSRESTISGTYSIADAQIKFVTTQGGTDTFSGSVVGTELRVLFSGRLFIYTK